MLVIIKGLMRRDVGTYIAMMRLRRRVREEVVCREDFKKSTVKGIYRRKQENTLSTKKANKKKR